MIHIKCNDANLEPIAVKIGIIGGSGLDDPDILENRKETEVNTPFGNPSDVLIEGEIGGVKCVLLARHGRKHNIMPTNVNYRANIWAMRQVGCTHLIVSTACGSLREEIHPGDLVVPNDFIDRTTKRAQTFYDGGAESPRGVCHLSMFPSFSERVRAVLIKSAKELDYNVHEKATIVTIEGPRFSSRSESNMFRQWGGDLINMTTCPEVVLAKEAGLLYGSVAIATDYDCWRMGCEGVNVQDVLKTFAENVVKVKNILIKAVQNLAKDDWTEDILDAKKLAKNLESNYTANMACCAASTKRASPKPTVPTGFCGCMVKVGIIGGSGLDDPDILEGREEKIVTTPFGAPADILIEGKIGGVKCILLARHGRKHNIMPSNVPYRANIWALKEAGCTHVLVSSACGSLREEYKRGDLVIPNDIIDRTTQRIETFTDGQPGSPPGVCHLPMSPCFNEATRQVLLAAAKKLSYNIHDGATVVCIEGPRYSSKAESKMFGRWGGDLINMTIVPEVVLAKEAGLLYAGIAIATDYDSWQEGQEAVNVAQVVDTFAVNVEKVKEIIKETVQMIAQQNWTDEIQKAQDTVKNNNQALK